MFRHLRFLSNKAKAGGSLDESSPAGTLHRRSDAMNRETYLEELQSRLEAWNAELERLKARASGARAGVRIMYEAQVAAFQHPLDEVTHQFKAIQAADALGWKALKQAADDACDRMTLAELKLRLELG